MHFRELTTEAEVRDLIEHHNKESKYVVLDTETTGLSYQNDTITDIVVNDRLPESAAIFSPSFIPLLREITVPLVCHNFRFDFRMLAKYGVDLRIPGLYCDTMLLDHLINENVEHGLDAIVQRRYNDNYKEIFWNEFKNYIDAPRDRQLAYACTDVISTKRLVKDSFEDLKAQSIPNSFIDHIKCLALNLYNTELDGISIDLPYLEALGANLSKQMPLLKDKIKSHAELQILMVENDKYESELAKRKTDKGKLGVKRPEFNWDSPKQLSSLIYGKLKLPVQYDDKKKPTLDDNALEKLAVLHPAIAALREYRGHKKIFGTYIEGTLKKMVNGRVHGSFNVNGTHTGRLSSADPNLQNLPIDGGVRGIYIPDSGYSFLSRDYGMLEVVLAAHYSMDKNLLKIIYEGASQHDITAEGLGVPRSLAKTINFAMQYGASSYKIKQVLKCTPKEAELALNKYWETYSGLRDFIKWCHNELLENRPIANLMGRKRRFPSKQQVQDEYGDKGFYSKESNEYIYMRDVVWRSYERQVFSSLIQGLGGDLTNRALYLVDKDLRQHQAGKSLFPIHDELIVQVKDSHIEYGHESLKRHMINVGKEVGMRVDLIVGDPKAMKRWEK